MTTPIVDYDDPEYPPFSLDVLINALRQDTDMELSYRTAICEALIHTEELWIVEIRTFLHSVGNLGEHRQHNYAVTLPGFPTFIVGSANELSSVQDLCAMLDKRGVIHVYPKNKPSN